MRRPLTVTTLMTAVLSVVASAAHAQTPPSPSNGDCQTCHGEASTTRANGQPVWVQPERFGQSVHGGLACVDCHADLASGAELPHPDRLKPAGCGSCHGEPIAQHAAGVHARTADGRLAARCVDCHGGAHAIKGSTDPASPTHTLNVAHTCAACHAKNGRTLGARGEVAAAFEDSIHGQALTRLGLVVAPTCSDCHHAHDVRSKREAGSLVHPASVAATCGRCHAGIQREYEAGVHAARLRAGAPQAPTCSTCHSAHSIRRTDTASFQLDVIQECGTCHEDKIRTYRDTFHGQVTSLGFERVAKCADCHGAHHVLPASNAASTVSPQHLLQTCSTCHDGAHASFVEYDPHPNPDDYQRSAVLWWTKRFYTVLIGGCFSFFGLHSLLWFWRSRAERRAVEPP